MSHIAVIDVGKTNVKLAVVHAQTLKEVSVRTRPNNVLTDGAWPHYDLDGHWAFFKDALREAHAQFSIEAISVTTHGAALTIIDRHGSAMPMMDYEFKGLDDATGYDALRPAFDETGSPRLPMGLNAGAQLYWMISEGHIRVEDIKAIVTYPQYWGFVLTGELSADVTSLGCHTDLWSPLQRDFSSLVDRLGLRGVMAEARNPSDVLGTIKPGLAHDLGMPETVPVMVGIHDSNASLVPYIKSRQTSFSVVSTGTWVITMSVNAASVMLDPERDTLFNVNAFGDPVATARFMGGREFETLLGEQAITPNDQDRDRVLNGVTLLPAVEPNTGPFAGRDMAWVGRVESPGEKYVAVSYYLALMTATCLDLIGVEGAIIVEGSFGRNQDYLTMLSALYPNRVEVAKSTTGTSIGAAMLCTDDVITPETRPVSVPQDDRFVAYARSWKAAVSS
jgi:sugar (pentulose or hexulose) kinase